MENDLCRNPCVAEVQGYDGPFGFSELLLQKIWLRGAYDGGRAATQEGRRVRVLRPGKWNRLGGPDFLGACLEVEGRRVDGDVELHLHAEDWDSHRHAQDPAYAGVVLHVVLFPPTEGYRARDRSGVAIATLVLLPLLPYDLEAFAWDDAAESLAGTGGHELWREVAGMEGEEVCEQVRIRGMARWEAKVQSASKRLERLGWEEACHAMALEIMGYRQNRVPMLMLAARWPLSAWRGGEVDVCAVMGDLEMSWTTMGVRPANQPRQRLLQYAQWTAKVPDWPERLWRMRTEIEAVGAGVDTPQAFRSLCGLRKIRELWCERLTGRSVGGNRWDSIVCDGCLPLLGARGVVPAEALWWHWYPGEAPDHVLRMLAPLGLSCTPAMPAMHGQVQGLLHWWFELDRSRWAGGSCRKDGECSSSPPSLVGAC